MDLLIEPIKDQDFAAVLKFTDKHIGEGYFSEDKLKKVFQGSKWQGQSMSFVLKDLKGNIFGVRLSYPPMQWPDRHPSQKLHPHLWRVELDKVAYFQSLFLADEAQGRGYGQRLSLASIEHLKMAGAKAVVCHSWNESPGNSSRRYLDKLGFQPVIDIPYYWKEIPYSCTRCGSPCLCTATEMILYL